MSTVSRRLRSLSFLGLSLSAVAASGGVFAQCPVASTYEGFHQERVGATLASFGDEAVFGGVDPGTGFFSRRRNDWWTRTGIFHSALPGTTTIATACDFRDDLVVLGSFRQNALGYTSGHGAIFLYERAAGSWSTAAEILPPNPTPLGGFGASVAIASDGQRVFVGEPAINGPDAVHVYVREPGGWVFQSTIPAPATGVSDGFGSSVEEVAGRLFVGAPGSFQDPMNVQQLLVFEEIGGTWTHVTTLTSGLLGWYGYGAVVTSDGTRLMLGVPGYTVPGSVASGLIVAYDLAQPGWETQPRFLLPPQDATLQSFGRSLDLSGDRMAVGASNRAFEYRLGAAGWEVVRDVEGFPESYSNNFAAVVGLVDGGFLVGDRSYDPNGFKYPDSPGAVHYFDTGDAGQSFQACGAGVALEYGGAAELRLDWPEYAGELYRVFGSITGQGPTMASGLAVPLTADAYTDFLQSFGTSPPFMPGGHGLLDAEGQAAVTLNVPNDLSLALDGLELHHAAIVFASDGTLDVTNAVTTELVKLF